MSRDLFSNTDTDRFSGDDEVFERIKLHDLDVALHYDTGKAVLISETGEEAKAVWLPRSQIEIHSTGKTIDAVKKDGEVVRVPLVTIVLPEWLAQEKGLL